MKSTTRFASGWMVLTIVVVLAGWFSASPITAAAQSQGNNAVYYELSVLPYSAACCQGSGAFIDASVFSTAYPNFCAILYNILNGSLLGTAGYPSTGAVIDARGLNSGNTTMTCAAGWTPWNNGSTFLNVPSTILLPAGTIVIPTTWVLPQNTRLIGVGDSIFSSSGIGTTIQVCKSMSCSFSGDMIDFGSASTCPSGCTSVSIENLALDGQGQSINGIVNQYSQALSYIEHVSLYQILGTGLSVSSQANNSGSYSNITFDTGAYSGAPSTVCASINGLSGTHGMSCNSESNIPQAAVLLDSSNNSIEDVRIVGFHDGIRVGANANAQSNAARHVGRLAAAPFYPARWATI